MTSQATPSSQESKATATTTDTMESTGQLNWKTLNLPPINLWSLPCYATYAARNLIKSVSVHGQAAHLTGTKQEPTSLDKMGTLDMKNKADRDIVLDSFTDWLAKSFENFSFDAPELEDGTIDAEKLGEAIAVHLRALGEFYKEYEKVIYE